MISISGTKKSMKYVKLVLSIIEKWRKKITEKDYMLKLNMNAH